MTARAPNGSAEVRLTVRLTCDLLDAVHRQAYSEDVNVNEWIRQAIKGRLDLLGKKVRT